MTIDYLFKKMVLIFQITHQTMYKECYNVDFDYVITVFDHAKERCPFFPAKAKKYHQNFPDPAKASGTAEEINEQFRQDRQQIKKYYRKFIANNL
ncbi:MAG: hypothetical protein QM751_06005 [Paludibacteraceae bacterium]